MKTDGRSTFNTAAESIEIIMGVVVVWKCGINKYTKNRNPTIIFYSFVMPIFILILILQNRNEK